MFTNQMCSIFYFKGRTQLLPSGAYFKGRIQLLPVSVVMQHRGPQVANDSGSSYQYPETKSSLRKIVLIKEDVD